MNSDQIKVRSGEPVEDAWKRLVAWVESLKIIRHPSYRVKEIAGGGIQITSTQVTQFSHPFYTSAGFTGISVSSGLVNHLVPLMKDHSSGKLKRLDNRDEKGKPITNENPPMLELDLSKSSDDGRIFVLVRVEPLKKNAKGVAAQLTAKDITIVQGVNPDGSSKAGTKDGAGYYPLAMIYLSQDRASIGQVFQITHHNLLYRFQERNATAEELLEAPKEKTVGRHIFRPA